LFALLLTLCLVPRALADEPAEPATVYGLALTIGIRADNVRMSAGSPAGLKAGPTVDLAFYVDAPLDLVNTLRIHVPLFRPIFLGVAYRMLQFEPHVALLFRTTTSSWDQPPEYRREEVIGGPVFGLALHYGPGYASTYRRDTRDPSFFAIGPIFGGYLAHDRTVIDAALASSIGFMAAVTPLFGNLPNGKVGLAVGVHGEFAGHSRRW